MADRTAEAFRALADPTRREILDLLLESGPLRAGDIAGQFGEVTRIAISKHLRVLREADLLRVVDSEDARERHYGLKQEGFAEVQAWMQRYEVFWQQRLGILKRLVEDSEKRG